MFTGNVGFGGGAGAAGKGKGGGKGGAGKGGGAGGGVGLQVQLDDTAPDTTTFDVQATATAAIPLEGINYWFNLPGANFATGSAELVRRRQCRCHESLPRRLAGGQHALCRRYRQIHPH